MDERVSEAAVCVRSRQNQLKDQQHQQQQQVVSLCQLPDEAECLTVPRYKRDLVQKLKILRQELSQQQPQAGHCRIEVSREEIFEVTRDLDSFLSKGERGGVVFSCVKELFTSMEPRRLQFKLGFYHGEEEAFQGIPRQSWN